jgi:hypothetical protein
MGWTSRHDDPPLGNLPYSSGAVVAADRRFVATIHLQRDRVQRDRGNCGARRGVGSVIPALAGFGLGSVIEVASAAAVAWQFAGRDPEAREKTTRRGVRALLGPSKAEHSTVGLVLAAVSLAVIPLIGYGQRRTGPLRLSADPDLTFLGRYRSRRPTRRPGGAVAALRQAVNVCTGMPRYSDTSWTDRGLF